MIINKIVLIIGMNCISCATFIEKKLNKIKGILKISVNFSTQIAIIKFEDSIINFNEISFFIKKQGYKLIYDINNNIFLKRNIIQYNEYLKLKQKTIYSFILTLFIIILYNFFYNIYLINFLIMILSFYTIFFIAKNFFIKAWLEFKKYNFGMNFLIVLGVSISFLYSSFNILYFNIKDTNIYFETTNMIIFFALLGKTFESYIRNKANNNIQKLIITQLYNEKFSIIRKGIEYFKSVEEIKIDDLLIIKPGDKIPVDGIIVSGHSYIDMSILTGESTPIFKTQGNKIYCGSINKTDIFTMKVEKIGSYTFLFEMIRFVNDSQKSNFKFKKIINSFINFFIPIVILISLLTFFFWGVIYHSWNIAFSNMISVLVISCPCTLGLAIPMALLYAVEKAALYGILIKDYESLETAYKINTLIFDKTGTLTEGEPIIKKIHWCIKDNIKKYIFILKSIEKYSNHPLSKAILDYFKDQKKYKLNKNIINVKEYPGMGIEAVFENTKYYIGNIYWLIKNNIILTKEIIKNIKDWRNKSYTIVGFAKKNILLSIFLISDAIKKESYETIKQLKILGIDIYMLTGDELTPAKFVADTLSIKKYYFSQLPNDKYYFIKKLQNKGKIVAMIGDGINDVKALYKADLSIAMSRGSYITMNTANITLIGDNLKKISKIFYLSKKTMIIIRQNLFWTFIYNTISIILASGILYRVIDNIMITPMIAAFAMTMSSISVTLNSYRLYKIKL